MKKIDNGMFELSSGKQFYAYENILGINEKMEYLHNGYDGCDNIVNDEYSTSEFTPDEIIEICDYMIDLWTKLKDKQIK
jgi:hypothetical protein